jgi:hypothetical protein
MVDDTARLESAAPCDSVTDRVIQVENIVRLGRRILPQPVAKMPLSLAWSCESKKRGVLHPSRSPQDFRSRKFSVGRDSGKC